MMLYDLKQWILQYFTLNTIISDDKSFNNVLLWSLNKKLLIFINVLRKNEIFFTVFSCYTSSKELIIRVIDVIVTEVQSYVSFEQEITSHHYEWNQQRNMKWMECFWEENILKNNNLFILKVINVFFLQ